MRGWRAGGLAAASICLFLAFGQATGRAENASPIDPAVDRAEIIELTQQAYFWGAQQVGFYELRYVFTQLEQAPAFRGLNRIAQNRQLFTAQQRFATTPNSSTLYAGGMFDVSREPVVVQMAAIAGSPRYWSVTAQDPYAHYFFLIGSQSTGNAAQRYLIVGPHWKGALPDGWRGVEIVRATADSFAATLRVAVTTRDAQDFAAAHALMDGFSIVPLSLWQANGGAAPPLAQQPIVRGEYEAFPRMAEISDLAKTMQGVDFLRLVSLVINDPTLTQRTDSLKERELLRRLARIGLRKGTAFDPTRLTALQRRAVEEGHRLARIEARAAFERSLIDMNGWKLQTSLDYDESDFPLRAGAADIAWGSPVPYQSHTIAFGLADAEGQPLHGSHRYTLTFALDALPPVTEFWELPVYDEFGYFVDNRIDRYSVTSYQLRAGQFAVRDGTLTFCLQSERPREPEQARNWLPVPRGARFQLAARFYGPTSGLIDGSYAMPRIVRVRD